VFAICSALRLARFNVQIEDPNKPAWAGNFFTGVPAPAGAILALLPIYLGFLQVAVPTSVTFVYTLVIAGLMVSRLPVLSGKKMGTRVKTEMVAPVILVAVLMIALLVSYPWHLLSVGAIVYLLALPLGYFAYQKQVAADAALAAATPAGTDAMPVAPPGVSPEEDRPARLN
jgi:CDP-diacylglycerol--serine O-phosphatidyltransferase